MLADTVCAQLCGLGVKALFRDVVDSTQDEALRLAREGSPDGTVVAAGIQTAGRGRQGRTWLSPAGGFYASVLFRSDGEAPPDLTVRAGLAVVQALHAAGVAAARLKWPNDCLVDGRKLCGILAEAFPSEGILVLGIGMNVAPHPDLRAASGLPGGYSAASLGEFPHVDPASLCVDIVTRLIRSFRAARGGEPLDSAAVDSMLWSRGPAGAGSGNSVVTGIVAGVDGSGRLMLRQPDGRIRLVSFGEVHDAGGH